MSPAVTIADPGEVLAAGPGDPPAWRWLAYRLDDGATVAACYVAGRLLRRNHREWWVVDFLGKRQTVKGDPVARLAGTAPVGWPLHPEHVELAGGGTRVS